MFGDGPETLCNNPEHLRIPDLGVPVTQYMEPYPCDRPLNLDLVHCLKNLSHVRHQPNTV